MDVRALIPPDAVEIGRTQTSKLYQRSGGRFTSVASIGPMHVPADVGAWKRGEPVDWTDPDTKLEQKPSGVSGVTNAYYALELLPGEIGYQYVSKVAGLVRVRLMAMDGKQIAAVPAPRMVGNEVFWDEVVPDLDLFLRCGVISAEIFKRIKTAAAPRSFTWEIEETDPPILNLKVITQGQDNELYLEPQRAGLGPGWARRYVEMQHTQGKFDTSVPGLRAYQVVETWTGRTFRLARTPQRELEFFDDAVFPVLIDQDVSEAIGADGDDGDQIGTTTWENNYNGNTTKHIIYNAGTVRRPGYRFQTVAIPQAATIDDATFAIFINSASGSATSGTLFGNDVDDAPAWATNAGPQNMTPTTASTAWNVPNGNAHDTYSVSVAGIVQEIVNRAGWASGNDIGLGIQGALSGTYKYITDFGNGSEFATLVVNYTEGGASGITADLSQTLGTITLTGDATTAIAAALAQTLDAATLSADATAAISTDLSQTLGEISTTATATAAIVADLQVTLSAVTLLGQASTGGLTADLDQTLGALSIAGAATNAITASLEQGQFDSITISGAAAEAIVAALGMTLSDVTLSTQDAVPAAVAEAGQGGQYQFAPLLKGRRRRRSDDDEAILIKMLH